MRRSVRAHLLSLVAVVTLTVGVGSVYAFSWSLGQAEDDAVERMAFQSARAADSIRSAVDTATRSVAGLAAQPGLVGAIAQPSGCTLALDGVGAFPDVRLDVLRADGVVACSSGAFPVPRTAAVHADARWLAQALAATGPTVRMEDVDAVSGERAITVSAPVRAADGGAVGAAVVFLHLDPAAAAMTREFGGSPDVRFVLVDRQDRQLLSVSEQPQGPSAVGKNPFRDAPASGRVTAAGGDRLVHSSADVAGTDWRVHAALPHDKVFGEARGALVRQVSLAGLAMVVLVAGVWLIDRRVSRPLRDVIRAADEARADPGATRVREAGTAETAALARSFNAMLDIRAAHEAQLAYQASHDELTGLPNRAAFVQRLEQVLSDGVPVGVVNLGIDGFRTVNDAVGHQAGDELLREIADRLEGALRQGDVLARFGSDQFVVLCERVSEHQAVGVAVRMRAALAAPFQGPLGELSLTATAGIAIGTATSSRRLLREADTALHEAKRSGHSHHVYDPTMQSRAAAHLTTQRELDEALEASQLVVHYQPLVALATGEVVGAEALVRWQHPQRGLVPPSDFVPVAEQTGQICAIGELVLVQACGQAVRWAVAGHRLTVSVNVAAAQLREGGFPALVERVLGESGLAPDQLCLEITESSFMTGSSQLGQDLARLRELGVHLALDDFGTGYSSLSYLQRLPCDELKIDRSFVSRLDDGNRELHLVTAIIGMARALGLTVVAEGVETDRQRRLLSVLGCHQAQGYLYSRPVPEAEFSAYLATATSVASPRRRLSLA